MAKAHEIAHNLQFLHLPISVRLYLIMKLIYRDFTLFFDMFSKSSAAEFMYVGKHLIVITFALSTGKQSFKFLDFQ